MFSPDTTLHTQSGSSSRNPRRRQRKDSDSFRQAPQRKRSKLSDEAFVPPTNGKVNGNGSIGVNGYTPYGHSINALHTLEMPLREKKSAGVAKRASKGDGSIVLTRNANYVVKKLASFPDRFREKPTDPFRAFVLQSRPYTLALTHDHAYIFDYTVSNHPAVPRTLPLPFELKRSDPLPVGSIVQVGPSNEIGVVVVSPTSGKITFWENVDSAESLTLFQQTRQGVEGSVGSMFSGETVTDIVDAGPAGFILIFSTGRLAQLTVRDAQGRPRINVLFLRVGGNGSAGLLGSFKNVLTGSAWKRDIAAVRTKASDLKGQMDVITATKSGTFQLWDLSWDGHHTFKSEFNIHNDLLETIRGGSTPESRGQHVEGQILDFTVLPAPPTNGMEVSVAGGAPLSLLVLVAITGPSSLSYALVEVDIVQDAASIRRYITLHAYQQEDLSAGVSKGTIIVPSPGHTAVVVFNQAIVVASLVEKEETPEDQLMEDSGAAPRPFQDVLFIRKNAKLQFVGFAAEEPHRKEYDARCVLFARGFGIIRLTALAPEARPSIERQRVTAKSKIEQAVFFGPLPGAIIDFTPKGKITFSQDELEEAAVHISHEILTSSSQYIPAILPSMEQHLNLRAAALQGLATLLRLHYPPLSRRTKWFLLWNAEKLAAATAIWKHYQTRKQSQYKEQPLLDALIHLLHERFKSELQPHRGETDPVRQFFIRDLAHLQLLLPWAYRTIRGVYEEGAKDNRTLIRIVSEADDITLGGLQTAFAFREDHLVEYGLEGERVVDGVLESGYEDLPQIWTSTHNIVNNTKQLVDLAREVAYKCYEKEDAEDVPDEALVRHVASENPALVEVCCLIYMERYRWCLAQDNEKTRATGRSLREEFDGKTRSQLLTRLANIGQAYEGMNLAEKFHDMPTLVELVSEEAYYLHTMKFDSNDVDTQLEAKEKLEGIRKRIQRYFDLFGYEWAHAFFSSHITSGQAAVLFEKDMTSEKYLTKYLRSDPSRAKLSWINDIVGEHDLPAAAAALMTVAEDQEPNTWCKKIEGSLAKLALMAVKPDDCPDPGRLAQLEQRNKTGLQLLGVQEQLYAYIKPLVLESLDDDAALDQCMAFFAAQSVDERPALRQLLKRGFEALIGHRAMEAALLTDVLTLMNAHDETFEERVGRGQFGMALRVLDAAWEMLDPALRDATLRLVWKRAFLRDDWAALNDTTGRSDDEVEFALERTVLFGVLRESAIATDAFKSPSRLSPLAPSDCLGAGCSTADLAPRFPSEDLRQPIIADNAADDEVLRLYVEQCRLEHWVEATKRRVEETLADEAEREREKGKREVEVLRRVVGERGEGVVEEGSEDAGSRRGSGSGAEGDDERMPGGRFDDDGDVEME